MPIKRNASSDCLSIDYLITGSIPPLLNGWHLIILLNIRKIPLYGPCAFNASILYFEQVGSNLQFDPIKGDIIERQALIKAIKIFVKTVFKIINTKSSRQNFSSFFTSSRKYAFPAHTRHTFTKSVFVLSLPFAWLICSLHYYLRIKTMKLLIFMLQTN